MASETKLTLAFKGLKELSPKLIEKNAKSLTFLDLTENEIEDLYHLSPLKKLEVLIVDKNLVSCQSKVPRLPALHTLWLNSNKIENLPLFISKLESNTPGLKYLSMLNNKACPNFFNGGSRKQYVDYRHFVISKLPLLQALDSTAVTEDERKEAIRLYGSLSFASPPPAFPSTGSSSSLSPSPSTSSISTSASLTSLTSSTPSTPTTAKKKNTLKDDDQH